MTGTAGAATRDIDRASLTAPGILLGIGLGGFVDGIVLHQILQWHHLISDERSPTTFGNLQRNVTADGFFHTFTWLAVVSGLALLWRAVRHGGDEGGRHLAGSILAGWGAFNLVEGIVNHHLLRIHRVRPDATNPLAWDLGFLALGAVLILFGALLARSDPHHVVRYPEREGDA